MGLSTWRFTCVSDVCSLSTGVFKWKPDHLAAVQAFGDASKAFRKAGDMSGFVDALSRRAESQHALGNDLGAGIDLEAAAKALAPVAKSSPPENLKAAAASFETASGYFTLAAKPDRAADALLSCARCHEKVGDIPAMSAVLHRVLDVYSDGSRPIYAVDKGKACLPLLLRHRQYKSAMETMSSLSSWFSALKQPHNVAKMALSRIILLLAEGEVVGARREFSAALAAADGFAVSNEAEAAEELVLALEKQDAGRLAAAQGLRVLTYLENQVCRVAKEGLFVETDSGMASAATTARVAPASTSQAAGAAAVATAAASSDPLGLGGVALVAGSSPGAYGGGEETGAADQAADAEARAELFAAPAAAAAPEEHESTHGDVEVGVVEGSVCDAGAVDQISHEDDLL